MVKNENGEPIGIATICEDITERKRIEEEHKRSKERFETLFELAPDGYYLSDFTGAFLDGNRSAEELIGYKRDELIGKNFLDLELLSPEQIPKAAELLKRNFEGESTGPDEFTLKRKDGSFLPVEIRAHPVSIQGQALVLGMARDITKRKKLEDELRELINQQGREIQELSIPILQIWEDVLVLPLIGSIDTQRASQILEKLLDQVTEKQAGVVIIDITGLAGVDTNVANYLNNIFEAVKMLGARCIITGVSPDIATTMAGIGVTLEQVTTKGTLQAGLKEAVKINHGVRSPL